MDNDSFSSPPQPQTPPSAANERSSTTTATSQHQRQGSGDLSGSQMNGAGPKRPQTLMSPISSSTSTTPDQILPQPSKTLKLTIHKDENGYGMKVSGDKPVFVESVKPNGAAHKAGLIAADMILEVNGNSVRFATHTDVVKWIRASETVELTVQRGYKMQRPSSISVSPSTPLAQRGGITAPIPVDQNKRREMEFSKIQTLRLMLAQERKCCESLNASNVNNCNKEAVLKSEAKIRKLQEQLKQVCGEDLLQSPLFNAPPTVITPVSTAFIPSPPQPQQQHHSTPAFLSLFPRSLSSLSLGTRKKPEKDTPTMASPPSSIFSGGGGGGDGGMSSNLFRPIQSGGFSNAQQTQQNSMANAMAKKKTNNQDVPPPLPQRNAPRKSLDIGPNSNNFDLFRNTPVSDLDQSTGGGLIMSPNNNSSFNLSNNGNPLTSPNSKNFINSNANLEGPTKKPGGGKKRSKNKTKALSDPKMSSQMFLQMESGRGGGGGGDDMSSKPPPLPPRQYLLDENRLNNNFLANNNLSGSRNNNGNNGGQRGSGGGGGGSGSENGRPLPNSIETVFNYPLVSTCTSVRDNLSPFPFTHRPNIVQKLQQMQQQQQYPQQQQAPKRSQSMDDHHKNLALSTSTHISANKSTAFGLTTQQMQKIGSAGGGPAKHRRNISSPEHVQSSIREEQERGDFKMSKSTSSAWEVPEKKQEQTPPGTPPPPYLMSNNGSHKGMSPEESVTDHSACPQMANQVHQASAGQQKPIISMEDDEESDVESYVDELSPFRSLSQLLEAENSVYLTVFLNFVYSNSEPAPLLFYLITGIYRDGSAKDMRKWAYEIHSTFLVPRAPLQLPKVDESLAHEVDDVLQKESDKGEILRKIFWKSRVKAKEFINGQLQDFQVKRTAGLGTIYGPSDQLLHEAKGDKSKEQKIVEEYLIPKLQQLIEELEKESPNECPKKSALCSALSTVLHRIFVTRSTQSNPIDKVHHFVSREKSFKSRLMGKNRKEQVMGHSMVLQQYYEVTHCNHCQNIIWGISPQGYHCTNCELNIHRVCMRVLEEPCPGPAPQKRKEQHSDNKITKFMEKIRPTHHFIQMERSRRMDEEGANEDTFCVDRPVTTSVTRQPSDRRPTSDSNASNHHHFSGASSASAAAAGAGAAGGAGGGGGPGANGGGGSNNMSTSLGPSDVAGSNVFGGDPHSHDGPERLRYESSSKSAPVSVNRSESYKETLSHARTRNRRKTSDPSLTKTNDEQQVDLGLSNVTFTTSSQSSLSSNSLENSPSLSLETVGANTTTGVVPAPRQWVDSEDECAGDDDWSSHIAPEILQTISDGEKKRQEIINEIYLTERNHVRTLRLLEGIFMRPLQEQGVLNTDHLQLLFPPALITLKDLHSSFEVQLKQRRIDCATLVGDIGDLLLAMFDGQSGVELKNNAAQFCARQRIALEALKEKRRKDENLQRLLTKAESHKACRRLQLKDLLPTALQRLTKYPLLFESLYKITVRVSPEKNDEAEAIRKALTNSRDILNHVNQAVREAEDAHKLQSIQRKLDKSSFDRESSNSEYKNLDLTQHKLIHSGVLIMKKNPTTQFHGLLFEDIMVLLQKQDDRYILKNYNNPSAGGVGENKSLEGKFFPIIKTNLILVRSSAVDKTTFFLINTTLSQMLELTAPSNSECKAWLKHIPETADAYKSRLRGINPDLATPTDDIQTHPSAHHPLQGTGGANVQSKDSFESVNSGGGTPERGDLPTIHQSDLTNIKLKSGGGKHGLEKKGSSNFNHNHSHHHQNHGHHGHENKKHHHVTHSHYSNAGHKGHKGAKGSRQQQHQGKSGSSRVSLDNNDENNNDSNSNNAADDREQTCDNNYDESDEEEEEEVMDGEGEEEDPEEQDDSAADDSDNNNDDNEQRRRQRRNNAKTNGYTNSNDTRTLTQQCSLVAPSEVQITVNPALIAEPVLTESEKLRRIDEFIAEKLAEKQKIVCNLFRMPDEDFHTIVDIASQPEAPQEPCDLVLAAYSQIQSLISTLNESIRVTPHQEICAVATGSLNLCDSCHSSKTTDGATEKKVVAAVDQKPASKPKQLERGRPILVQEDEDGYCEIIDITGDGPRNKPKSEEIIDGSASSTNQPTSERCEEVHRQDSIPEETEAEMKNEDSHQPIPASEIPQTVQESVIAANNNPETELKSEVQNNSDDVIVSETEIIVKVENADEFFATTKKLSDQLVSSALSVPCHLITNQISALNQHITKLMYKLQERDQERDNLKREVQHLSGLLSSMHIQQGRISSVSESEET